MPALSQLRATSHPNGLLSQKLCQYRLALIFVEWLASIFAHKIQLKLLY